MDELEAIKQAKEQLQEAKDSEMSYAVLNVEAFELLLARATRSHD